MEAKHKNKRIKVLGKKLQLFKGVYRVIRGS